MSRQRALIALAPLCLIAACTPPSRAKGGDGDASAPGANAADLQEAQQHMRSSMKDPDSVRFNDLRQVHLSDAQGASTIDAVCGAINAKNSMGGYVGFKPFAYVTRVRDLHPGAAHFEAGQTEFADESEVGPIVQWHAQDLDHICGSQTRYTSEAELMETAVAAVMNEQAK